MKTETLTKKSETVLLYSVRVSGYKDYVSLMLGESEIFQHKTNVENCGFIAQELNLLCKAVNNHEALLSALKDAHKMLHKLSDNYCRNKEGYLKDSAAINGWDAEVDLKIEEAIKKASE